MGGFQEWLLILLHPIPTTSMHTVLRLCSTSQLNEKQTSSLQGLRGTAEGVCMCMCVGGGSKVARWDGRGAKGESLLKWRGGTCQKGK